MKLQRTFIALLCFVLCGHALAQDMDTELSNLTERLAVKIKDKNMKKVAVIDFTDLQGGSSELGKYIAEQMTVDFVMTNRSFSVLDRANLKRILAEHKLTSQGLVDPDNAKKLGMFAGVDAIILGTIIPKGEKISLTAKIITTETAEIVGGDKAGFKTDDTVKQLMSQQTAGSSAGGIDNETAKVTKKLGDLTVGSLSLQIVDGGSQYLLTMTLANTSPKKSIWVAVRGGMFGNSQPTLTTPSGVQFGGHDVTGIPATLYQNNGFAQATEIPSGDSVPVTIKFSSLQGTAASVGAGQYTVQMEFLLGYDFNNGSGQCSVKNFVAKFTANN